ncbi:aspartate aminotransferase family protein [Kordiimonas marina]|uniref:aminotransferase family protein n=1 Tax=Kordiimonas marina TaxID=2872312 RepID=UPI001FF19441|nr:aminotransferase class III-fold pyridoxal phosphate-dependent enzyme [Kordiimonas marina]MCJ9430642.1 aminotransferase class III-fold pyridoxal phosphate-dependent enzyme [Kordiimonas marina]
MTLPNNDPKTVISSLRKNLGCPQDLFYSAANKVPLPIIERAEGVYLFGEDGKRYIDVSSGPVVSNIGHGNAHVADAMAAQAKRMDFAYSRTSRHRPNMELTARIAALAGPGYERVCLASGGSEAMEAALKFLRQYAVAKGQGSKRTIISCNPSYHGGTIGTLSITGDDALRPFLDGFSIPSEKIPAALTYRTPAGTDAEAYARQCADALDAKIRELGAENILCFVVEPVGGLSTGCNVPPDIFFNRVRDICTTHGVYLVYDEVLCGTGRTGKFLASHHYPEARPDIVVLAKGLGSGYTPLGAMLAPAAMVDELADLTGFNFSHTYNANPVTCAAGLAVLDVYEKEGLVKQAETRGAYLRAGLEALQKREPIIGDIRGRGMLMALEFVADPATKAILPAETNAVERIRTLGLAHGLMIYSRRTAGGKNGDWIMVSPPMTITEAECDDLVARLEETLVAFRGEVKDRLGLVL